MLPSPEGQAEQIRNNRGMGQEHKLISRKAKKGTSERPIRVFSFFYFVRLL